MAREGRLEVVFRNNDKDGLFSIEVDGIEVIHGLSEEKLSLVNEMSGELSYLSIVLEGED